MFLLSGGRREASIYGFSNMRESLDERVVRVTDCDWVLKNSNKMLSCVVAVRVSVFVSFVCSDFLFP